MTRKFVLSMGFAAACMAAAVAHAQVSACKGAEEVIADVSVQIVKAYNSMDFDKAKEIGKVIVSQIEKGEQTAKECGCPAAMGPLAQTRGLASKALESNDFSEVQASLADTILVAEKARGEAEQCWRKAAAASSQGKAPEKKG